MFKVLIIDPLKSPYVKKINSEICYDEIDKLIGDITEYIYLENGLVAIIDETGKSKNLTANRYITNSKGYKHLIAGRIVLAGLDNNNNLIGLNNTQIDIYSDLWKTPEIIDQKEVIKLVWCNF